MSIKLRPLGDRVVVRRIEEGETLRNGIYIPDAAKEKPMEGEVVAVGPGRHRETATSGRVPVDVKSGDRVLFGKYSGTEIKIEDEELLILREEEILTVLEGKSTRKVSHT